MQLKAVDKKSSALEHVRLKIKCDLPRSSPVVWPVVYCTACMCGSYVSGFIILKFLVGASGLRCTCSPKIQAHTCCRTKNAVGIVLLKRKVFVTCRSRLMHIVLGNIRITSAFTAVLECYAA
jgi:hypothetical protein